MKGNTKHLVSIVIVLAILGGLYFLNRDGALLGNTHTRAANIQAETEALKQEIIVPLARLNRVRIDQTFFVSPEYEALEDMSVELAEPVTGRTDPFAPISF